MLACVAALSIGLGVGLTRDNETDEPGNPESLEPWKDFRLPDAIVPVLYSITLRPDVIDDISYGSEDITVDVRRKTRLGSPLLFSMSDRVLYFIYYD